MREAVTMGLNDTGPRDWSPEAGNYVWTRGVSASIPPIGRPLRPSRYRASAPRSGAWAPFVLALVALFLSVAEFRLGASTGFIVSTIGILAAFGGATALRRIRSGHRGSAALASSAIWIGAAATVLMVVRLIAAHFAPTLYAELPLIPLYSQVQDVSATAAVAQTAGASIQTSSTPLAQELGTVVLLIAQLPAGTDLGAIELAHGVIVLPNGAVVNAPDVQRMKISINKADGAFAVTLVNAAGDRAHYSSRDSVITAG